MVSTVTYIFGVFFLISISSACARQNPVVRKSLLSKRIIKDLKSINTSGDYIKRYKNSVVVGDTTAIGPDHPVIQAVVDRWKSDSKPGKRAADDKYKIALSIEGGGMRGCVSAGCTAALNFLGINDAVDVVYGSSAGAMIASYFISRQFSGVQIYHGKIWIILY